MLDYRKILGDPRTRQEIISELKQDSFSLRKFHFCDKIYLSSKKDTKMIDKIYLEITNVCNLDCSFCHKTKREKRLMTAEEFENLTDKLQGKAKFLHGRPPYFSRKNTT